MRDQDETDGEGALTLSVQADLFGNPFESTARSAFKYPVRWSLAQLRDYHKGRKNVSVDDGAVQRRCPCAPAAATDRGQNAKKKPRTYAKTGA